MSTHTPTPPGTPLPEHGACFVCGHSNPKSIGITWYALPNGHITTTFTFTEAQQGPPGFLHGGASAAVLDEAMGAAVWTAGHPVVSVNLNIDYHQPVPLGVPVTVEAYIVGRDGKALHTASEIRLPDGSVAVSGRGIYVAAPKLFNQEAVEAWLGRETNP